MKMEEKIMKKQKGRSRARGEERVRMKVRVNASKCREFDGKKQMAVEDYISFFPLFLSLPYSQWDLMKKNKKTNRNRCSYAPDHHNVRLSPFVFLFQNAGSLN